MDHEKNPCQGKMDVEKNNSLINRHKYTNKYKINKYSQLIKEIPVQTTLMYLIHMVTFFSSEDLTYMRVCNKRQRQNAASRLTHQFKKIKINI